MKWTEVSTGGVVAFLSRFMPALGEDVEEIIEAVKDDPSLAEEVADHLRTLVARRNIITVDRAAPLPYPDWVERVLHLELEQTGPARYDVATDVELWLHEGQSGTKYVKGQVIYDYLSANHLLPSCAGLADLLAIQAKGINFFRKHFAGKAVFGWRSVVRNRDGYRRAPSLYDDGHLVVLHWRWLAHGWFDSDPALRFRHSPEISKS